VAEEKLAPPYLSYRTLRNYIEALSVTPMPDRIDRTVLGNLSGQVQTQLLNALRYLGLITDSGNPTESLRKLVTTEGDDRKKMLAQVLRHRYPFLFSGFNLQGATPGQIRERFESEGVSGDTTRKSVGFFLAAAKDAEIQLSPHVRMRAMKKPRRRQGISANGNNDSPLPPVVNPLPPERPRNVSEILFELLDPDQMDETEQQAIWTLLRYLKKRGVRS